MRILLVEDNTGLAAGIQNALRDSGYAVDHLVSGQDADDFLRQEGTDLAIVDVNLPGLNGFEIVRNIRQRDDKTLVLMLTARGDTADRVTGLDAGADDYLVKPFEIAELLARVRALSRRRADLRPIREDIGLLTYDHGARALSGPTGVIDLKRRERALFECLLFSVGRVITKEQLVEQLYGAGAEVEANAVELAISRLRRELDGTGVRIQTVRGVGYMMSAS